MIDLPVEPRRSDLASYIAMSASDSSVATVAPLVDSAMPTLAPMRIAPTSSRYGWDTADSSRLASPRAAGVVHVLGDDDELVAADPSDEVALTDGVVESLADLAEHLVAGLVTPQVVHRLELVEVDEQHGEGPLRLEQLMELLDQLTATSGRSAHRARRGTRAPRAPTSAP